MTPKPKSSPAPTSVILRHLPALQDAEAWLLLTPTERDDWHLALGTATNWLEDHLVAGGSGAQDFAALLEELARSDDPDIVNAVVIDALDLLDFDRPALTTLLASLGEQTKHLRAEWPIERKGTSLRAPHDKLPGSGGGSTD